MKKNYKAFTLVELIVVIAIIGVLAAILVPSMVTFVNDAKISAANSGANAVYKATQAWVTKESTKLVGSKVTADTFYFNEDNSGTDAYTFDSNDLSDYLGKDFNGYAGFKTSADGTTVLYALWNEFTAVTDLQLTEALQESNAATGNYTGCYPLATHS